MLRREFDTGFGELQRGAAVQMHYEEVTTGFGRRQREDAGEKGRRIVLVVCGDDRVVEQNGQRVVSRET
ncbi:hypothetical protein IL38_22110 [Actinopolyspora erythraea]|uniref:Uncharacterized protein n=1 Tax=Actinopolyspora erythraea TaxID=414996 RepID=A0ABR4WZB7_9ACTN|nr:hypothetical protein IL38_22110 [Actinopolyspora erythraea]